MTALIGRIGLLRHSKNIGIRTLKGEELSFPTIEKNLPLVFTPKKDRSYQSLLYFIKSNGGLLKKVVNKFGGILLRGFQIPDVSAFSEILELMGYRLSEKYLGGLSPRHEITKKIFTSTDVVDLLPLYAHNEMSFQNWIPAMIAFFCQTEPKKFGETPIFNSAEISNSIPPELHKVLLERNITYMRRYRKDSPMSPFGFSRAWPAMFGTRDKNAIEALCEENGAKCIWGKRDSLIIQTTTFPYTVHPITHEKCFSIHLLNQYMVSADMKNVSNRINFFEWLYSSLGMLLVHLFFHLKMVPMSVSYGDGKSLSRKITLLIRDRIWKHSVVFKWRQNDILILDNIRTAHGRLNVVQPRKIAAAMGDMTHIQRTV